MKKLKGWLAEQLKTAPSIRDEGFFGPASSIADWLEDNNDADIDFIDYPHTKGKMRFCRYWEALDYTLRRAKADERFKTKHLRVFGGTTYAAVIPQRFRLKPQPNTNN